MGKQLDLLDIADQLHIVSSIDILLGMHGAALGYSVLLQPGGGVIEMFPKYYTSKNWHMEHLIRSNGLHYTAWKNINKSLEGHGLTTVDTKLIIPLLKKVILKVCNNS